MPLVDITYEAGIDERQLRRLGDLVAEVVPLAVECPEEPVVGPPAAGDLEVRFHRKSPLDHVGLNVVVEIRTRRFESRVRDAQRRADMVRERLATLSLGSVGVWLVLLEGAWSQD